MPNPKRKHTARRRDTRRAANWKVVSTNSSKCPNCGAARLPHCICPSCGFYNKQLVIPKKEKKDKQQEEGKK